MAVFNGAFFCVVRPKGDLRHTMFRNQHVIGKMVVGDCTAKMNDPQKEINNNYCKRLNTFIVGAGQRIRTMCGSKIGTVTSPDTFNTIDCKLQQGSVYPNCVYLTGSAVTRRITVTCVNGYPVHYVG
uniref:Ribonuclease A-domain domain-containing protein n=1 Tax=Labrus bergylta TaxID=56723 RepID=A0A3Q3GWQ1_9LABR